MFHRFGYANRSSRSPGTLDSRTSTSHSRSSSYAALGAVHHAEPRGDQLFVRPRQRRRGEAHRIEAPHRAARAHDALALEQEAHQLVDRARRSAEGARVGDHAIGNRLDRLEQLAHELLGVVGTERGEIEPRQRNVAFAERRMTLEQGGGRGRDDQHRRLAETGGEVLDEVYGLGAGVLKILKPKQHQTAHSIRARAASDGARLRRRTAGAAP
jgi:hypothetical protein